jgi:hypothetical protein
MPSSNDPRLLAPQQYPTAAYEQEKHIKDVNDSQRSDDQVWLSTAHDQKEEINARNVDFFKELRQPRGD